MELLELCRLGIHQLALWRSRSSRPDRWSHSLLHPDLCLESARSARCQDRFPRHHQSRTLRHAGTDSLFRDQHLGMDQASASRQKPREPEEDYPVRLRLSPCLMRMRLHRLQRYVWGFQSVRPWNFNLSVEPRRSSATQKITLRNPIILWRAQARPRNPGCPRAFVQAQSVARCH